MTAPAKYEYKHPPYAHQREVLQRSHNQRGYALFMDPGTGKTYVVINNTAYWYERGEVDALLIIAPNGVHQNWVTDELPKHVPDRIPYEAVIWRTGRMTRRVDTKLKFKPELESLLVTPKLAVLAMNYEAVLSDIGSKFAMQFLERRKVVLAADEADEYMAEPDSKRFKRIMAMIRRAKVSRPMTGTPVEEKPEHAYGIMKAVDENFWKPIADYASFKNKICEFEVRTNLDGRSYKVRTAYKNLAWLHDKMFSRAFRYLKDDLGLPPKRFTKWFVELSEEQQRMYKELVAEKRTFFQSGEVVSAELTLTNLLRRQQIVCGYVPPDRQLLTLTPEMLEDDELLEAAIEKVPLKFIDGPNLRLEALQVCVAKYPVKTMIWARFTPDIDQIMSVLGDSAVRYDGTVNDDDRTIAKERYLNDPSVLYFVGHPKAGGRGLTFINTEHVVFYSNMFGARPRTQAEDRAHRIGLQHSVLYTDLCALGTIDTYIIEKLRAKKNVARELMGDPPKEWI
jgi:SNF2 family DNA or RNA helicase